MFNRKVLANRPFRDEEVTMHLHPTMVEFDIPKLCHVIAFAKPMADRGTALIQHATGLCAGLLPLDS